MVSNIFYFHSYLGKWSNLTNIFQMGWNHQLDVVHDVFPEKNGELYLYGAGNEYKRISFPRLVFFGCCWGACAFDQTLFVGFLVITQQWFTGGKVVFRHIRLWVKIIDPHRMAWISILTKEVGNFHNLGVAKKKGYPTFHLGFFVVFFFPGEFPG